MDSPERLQRRISTLGELQTIVRTMKALSAISIRQYEKAVGALAHYNRTVELGLQVVLQDTANHTPEAHRFTEPAGLAAIVFGTDHGLCGRFNEDIAVYALQRLQASVAVRNAPRLLAVGTRVAADLEQAGQFVEGDFLVPGSAAHITATVQQIIGKIDKWRSDGNVHYVYLYYNRHLNGGGYAPTEMELLPVNLHRFQRLESKPWPSRRLPMFTMERHSLLSALLRQHLFVSIFRACAESLASEHTSRLAAMQSAEKNLDEKREELTTQFRRLRQEAITTELLDVVSGYEAVTAGN